jgi:hypothetical protein
MSDTPKEPAAARLSTHRKVAERYDVSTKTIDRWVSAGILERPIYIRGRKYHREGVEPRRDNSTHG